jgi:MFS family permease
MNTETAHASSPAVSRWWILFLVHLSVLAFALNLQMVPPLLPRLISEIGLTHTQVGVLMGLFTLPGIFLAIPGGKVSDAIGPRSVALWSLALLTVGALLMVPLHPWFLYLGRLCSGIGGAVLVVVAPQIIARTFHGRELGMAMGIFNTAVPIGTIAAFNLLGFVGGRFGIPVVFMATASFSLVAMTAFFLTYADPQQDAMQNPSIGQEKLPPLGGALWLISLVWVLFNISILAYFTYAIDYFTGSGMDGSAARFLSSLPMIVSIFLTFVNLYHKRYTT